MKINQINPRKLHHSKWTAVRPMNGEKHFLVVKVVFDEENNVDDCQLEAVLTKSCQSIDWHDLKNKQAWLQGWV